jgi:(E)-4-hydroxy-3-methylbut-2-enyl-diphosphate synthase
MIRLRSSKPIRVGNVTIGGGAPIRVQSMTKTDTRDITATVSQIGELADIGCEIIRCAVPDIEAAEALRLIKQSIHIPLIADIHFDYRLALAAIEAGVDGIRLNPGNLGAPEQVASIVRAAKEREVPIRIGVNAGSLPQKAWDDSLTQRMVEAALQQIKFLESLDFDLIKVSLKAFDILQTVEAYRLIAKKIPYPLHLGITEAGLPFEGSIRSALGIGILLGEGIGDTIRVSLTGDPKLEVRAGYEILKSLGLREQGVTLLSCPTCGRAEIDLFPIAAEIEQRLSRIKKPLRVALCACVVNGPGEARYADVGLAGGKKKGAIFRKGEVVKVVEEDKLVDALVEEIEKL